MTDFSEILAPDLKLKLGKVLQVSCRYLPLLLSYRENPVEGAESAPPLPSGARVNCVPYLSGI